MKVFICGGPDMAPALSQRRTTVSLKLFSCGALGMAVAFVKLFSGAGPGMAPALPQGACARRRR